MPYLTTRKKPKLQLSPGLVASYDIQPGNGVGLFWDTTHTPDPHGGVVSVVSSQLAASSFTSYSHFNWTRFQNLLLNVCQLGVHNNLIHDELWMSTQYLMVQVVTYGACVVFQRQATYSGIHHFKCPLCNNRDEFQAEMLKFGIYIPDQWVSQCRFSLQTHSCVDCILSLVPHY